MEFAWQESLFADPADVGRAAKDSAATPASAERQMATPDAGRTASETAASDTHGTARESTGDHAQDPAATTPDHVQDPAATTADPRPGGMRRLHLDAHSWLDLATSWLPDHDQLFADLVRAAPWQQRERRMYDADVLEPRLVAAWTGDELTALPDRVNQIRQALGRHYGVEFDSVLLNLYRDGRDGVAWHGDRVRHRLERAVVVTIGLGERRRFLLRPGTSGPPAVTLTSGEGDLIVMGGRCQNEWQHTVPKAAGAGARMSVTMRHSAPLPVTTA